jgi:hypothetical protein
MSKKFKLGLFFAATLASMLASVAQATTSLQSTLGYHVSIDKPIAYTADLANSTGTGFATRSATSFANGNTKNSWLSDSASSSVHPVNSFSYENSKHSEYEVKSRHGNLMVAVPEPETYILLLAGLGLFVLMRR